MTSLSKPFAGMLAALGFLVGEIGPAAARPRSPQACRAEVGAAAARSLVRDCRDSSPAALALCRPETPCEAMREMIAEACRIPGAEAKPVCRDHLEEAEDDDDEGE